MTEDETIKLLNFLRCVHDFEKNIPAFQTKLSKKGDNIGKKLWLVLKI